MTTHVSAQPITTPSDAERALAEAHAHNARTRRNQRISAVIRYVILAGVGLLMLYPLIWLVGASFKTNAEIFASPGFIPANPTTDGFANA